MATPAKTRRAKRVQRQRGAGIYLTQEELRAAGVDPDAAPPAYNVRALPAGVIVIFLYAQDAPDG